MASPFSGVVLAAGAALTSPTLYGAFVVQTVPVEDALIRLLVVVAITTVAVTLVQWVFQGTSQAASSHLDDAGRSRDPGSEGGALQEAPTSSSAATRGESLTD